MKLLTLTLSLFLLLMLSACENNSAVSKPAKKRTPPVHLVETLTAEPSAVSIDYQRTGTLRHRKLAHIYTREAGQLTNLPWYEGDEVTTDQVLAQFDDALLRAESGKANANTRQAKRDMARIQELLKKGAASKDELLHAKTTLEIVRAEQKILDTRLGYFTIKAPFSGIISQRLVEPGDVIPQHTHILTLVDPSSLITEVSVSELLLPNLRTGDKAMLRIDALGQEKFSGEVIRIHPVLDPNSRQGKVEIKLDPIPAAARAGQFVRVTLHTASKQRLLIPFTALRRDRAGEYVYLIQDDKAVHQDVVSGIKIGHQIEILSGVAAGNQVVKKGFMGLVDQKAVHINKTSEPK